VITPPQLSHGTIDRDSSFSEIVGPQSQRPPRVTLVLSSGSPHRTGCLPWTLFRRRSR